jgi:FtsP/CotA-like multicopper oxidase with cupredoxin domain
MPPRAPVSDTFPKAPELYAHGGVLRASLAAVMNPHTLMPSFSYNGKLGGGPTLRVMPGDRIEIAYRNELPGNDAMGNATNLHFHGLVGAPTAPGDETLHTMAMPGHTLHYVVRIGAHQQPGLYWYHPHAHGNTLRQVGLGGMSGAIVVGGFDRVNALDARFRERILVVRDVADPIDTNVLIEHPEMASHENENGAPNAPCVASHGTHLTVNDAIDPPIPIATGETQIFRLLNATGTRFLDISLGHAALRLFALDGVPLDAYPGERESKAFTHLVVAPGARAEFTVSNAQPGDRLETACYDAGPDGDADPRETLATLATSVPVAIASGVPAFAPRRNPLDAAIPAPVRDRTVVFTEVNRNGASTFAINGASYSPDAPSLFTIRSHEAHAFHIHQVHFVTLSIDGKPVPRYWRDTMTTPPMSRSVLLVDFRDPIVRGTFVFHCHLLDHEDGGMMAKITVQ